MPSRPVNYRREDRLAERESAGSLWLLLLAVCAVWLLAVMRWVLSDSVVPWDSKNQFYAFFRFLAESLHAGTSVFWNPYHYGGHPSIADPQSLIFSPPFLLWAWFDREPSLRSFDLIVLGHLLVGCLAMAGLGWRRGWPSAASLLAAVIFMLGGAASARLNHTGIIICYALFPLALLTLEVALERRSMLIAIAFALVAAMIVLGRNQVALLLCFMLAVLALRQILAAPSPLGFVRERAALLAVIAVIAIAVAGVPVVLTLQLAALSNRPEVTLGEALEASLHPANLASLTVPDVFGSHSAGFGYWGPHYTNTPEVAATDDSFNYLFVGAAPVILLIWFGVTGGWLAERGRRVMTLVLVGALLFSLGRYTPLFAFVFEHVPGFSYFRRPIDGTFIVLIAIAMLSGHLLADYVRRGLPQPRPLPLAIALAISIAILTGAGTLSALSDHGWDAVVEVGRTVPIAAIVIGALALLRRERHRGIAAGLIAIVSAGELLVWNAASRLNAENRTFYQVLETASAEDADALRMLSLELERRHREGARPRVEIVGLDGPWQNLAVVRKIEATTGYNPLRIGIYDRYVSPGERGWLAGERRFPASFSSYDCALARALGLEYLVLDRPIEKLAQLKRALGGEMLHAGPKVWIYRIAGATPRVKFSSRIEVADLDATTLTGELRNPPTLDRIVIDDDTPPSRRLLLNAMTGDRGAAVITSWRPGEVIIEVEAPNAGVLVLHDTYYPGWVAEVDGERVPILRAEVLFRGVEVPAGKHTVAFRFQPLTWDNMSNAVIQLIRPPAERVSVDPSMLWSSAEMR